MAPSSAPGEIASLLADAGLTATAGQADALLRYLNLLEQWGATYNLTAVRERQAMLTHHLADCLALLAPLSRHLTRGRVLDVGSGGGLPGVVIAIMLPGVEVTCVDAVAKKTAFIRQVAGALGMPRLVVKHSRVEQLRPGAGFDLITARAFASLSDFARLTHAQLASGGVWLAMKGRVPDDELAALPATVDAFHVEQLQVPGLAAQRCLVWMRPRRPAEPTGEAAPPNCDTLPA